jgi:hypothetical protein
MLAPKIVTNLADEIDVFCRPPLALLGLFYALLGAYAIGALRQRWRMTYTLGLIAKSYALVFVQEPLALVGTPYIIIIAYAVRSLPASVRAGIAALQQIDPAIEEASTNLGLTPGILFGTSRCRSFCRPSAPVSSSVSRGTSPASPRSFFSLPRAGASSRPSSSVRSSKAA